LSNRPNIILITADDMNWDAVGAYGCPTAKTTPNIDRLASEGMRFNFGHVTIAVCQPSRSAMLTGKYPHNSGGEAFFKLRHPNIPILPEILKDAGYSTGILGKVSHSTPYEDFEWDVSYDMEYLGIGRNPSIYRQLTSEFIRSSVENKKSFFLMANSHDPHRPFYGNDDKSWYDEPPETRASIPSKIFKEEDVGIPGFLEDLPEVRLEIAEYYSSVRRCDDTVGQILDELKTQNLEHNTLILFLSDNGMAFPFSKTNCYLNSTKTPWIVRWPDKIKPESVDSEHFISAIDILPTFLEAAGIKGKGDIDGKSFLPVLKGEKQEDRKMVYTQFSQTAGKRNYPMRCVQNKKFGYIFNPWSDGIKVFKNESQAGRTFKAMEKAAQENKDIMDRVNLFLYRVPEELYDFENDHNALVNLIDDPSYKDVLDDLRSKMKEYMVETSDPALNVFINKNDEDAKQSFFEQMKNEIGGE